MSDFNKGDFTQQGVDGHVRATLRLNEKRYVELDLTTNENARGCTISGNVHDRLNNLDYPIGAAPSGNIEITENTAEGEPLDVSQYATATVNVAGGGTTLYHVSGTIENQTSTSIQFYAPSILTQEVEGVTYSMASLSAGTISDEDEPVTFVTLLPEADNMTLYLKCILYGTQTINASNEVNCTVSIDNEDVSVTITGDNASFELTVVGTPE